MAANDVNRSSQLSQVLSVRLTDLELKRLHKTFINLRIQGDSVSEQLRIFFRSSYFRSIRVRRKRERIARERERNKANKDTLTHRLDGE